MEDRYKREIPVSEDLESCQTEESEVVAEGTVTPADTFLVTLNEMEERANRTRERLQESIDLLKQKLEESEIECEPLLSRPSPCDYLQWKKYKQVSGTLLLQDIRYPDDLFQALQPQRQRAEEEHRPVRVSEKDELPRTEWPILIKQGHAQYIPWASQDLDTLLSRLPDIHEGAGKWIRTFEEEITGKHLALGDIKALLAKCLGASKMNNILKQSGLLQAVDRPQADGVSFDKHRRDIWKTLRAEYPMQTDPGFLKGEPMGEAENPTTYIQRQLRCWKEELERDPEQDKVLTALFRTAIVEAMPATVKAKLEDVVGLNSKTHKEFRDHVVHAVEQYRKQELKIKNQEKELRRKLTQLQPEELINKKKVVQAVQKEDHPAVMAPVNTSVPVNPSATVNVQPHIWQHKQHLLEQSVQHRAQHQLSYFSSQTSQTTETGTDNNKKVDVAEEDSTTINKELVAHQECVGDAINLDTTEETAPSILGNKTSQWPQDSTMDNNKYKLKL
ncbi:hypothetical protein M9458_055750 [Cirrhinus mrigala]|uniref:Uncharacterized protein n=1 Tax=Cirrhinus mrigala TaxID=683832 RepID=A0ABD0MJE0_CIRMR